MTDTDAAPAGAKVPVWYWIAGIVGLLWFGLGAWDYTATQFRFDWYMASFTEEQLAHFYGFPTWFYAVWALSVWGSFLGAILLLVRSKFASLAFLIALITYVIASIYSYGFADAYAVMGWFGVIFGLVIFLSVLGYFWLARWAKMRGILT